MKRRLMAMGLLLTWALAWGSSALAAEETEVEVTLNGFEIELGHPILAWKGSTMVPVEEFCRSLGGDVQTASWDSSPLPGGILYRWAEDGSGVLTVEWYDRTVILTPGKEGAAFRDGVLYAPLRPLAEALGLTVEWTGVVELSYPKRQVYAESLEELFNAVAPDTEIALAQGEYSFADMDVEAIHNPYVLVDYDVFDTATGEYNTGAVYQVVIQNVRDLTITTGNYPTPTRISTPWAYADVWRFENCRRIELVSGIAVHDVEPGFCAGNCVELENCRDVNLLELTLDGSGAYGLCAINCRNVGLYSSVIQNCTYGAVSLWDSKDIELLNCRIRDCTGCFHLLEVCNTSDVRLWECYAIEGNSAGTLVESTYGSQNVVFDRCHFGENDFGGINGYGWQSSGGAVFVDCTGLS